MPEIFGHNVSTPALVAIIGGGGMAVWFAWKQHESSAAAASSGTSSSAIDPVTGLPYSQDNTVDPLTGMTYLAEATEYGSVSAAEQAVSGEAAADLADADDDDDLTGTSTDTSLEPVTDVPATEYASNAAWAQAVTAGLTDIGYTSTDVSAALGMYLGSLPLSTLADGVSSAAIVEAAIAEYGPPPVGSFQLIAASSTSTAAAGSTSTTTSSTGSTPASTGSTSTASGGKITTAPSGFRVVSVTGGDNVTLAWDKLTPAAGEGPVTAYVIGYGPSAAEDEKYTYTTGPDETSATIGGVGGGAAGTHYFVLWADPAPTGGPHAGPITATTTKS